MLVLGIIAAGGIFAGTNPAYTQYELVHHIKTSKTRFLISEPEILDAIVAAAKECDIPTSNIWIFDILGQAVPRGFRSWNELLQYGEEDWERFDDLETAKNTTATRLFSSGTTGLPKAAELTHYNSSIISSPLKFFCLSFKFFCGLFLAMLFPCFLQ
jgi:acyl-CoA synthetase (AMP-forming)/AMP-acid ligase II